MRITSLALADITEAMNRGVPRPLREKKGNAVGKTVNDDLHRAGMAYRTKVLGEARVREALSTADDFTDYYHILGNECAYSDGHHWHER